MRNFLGIIFIFVTLFGLSSIGFGAGFGVAAKIEPINERKELTLDQLSDIILSPANHVRQVEDVVPLLPDVLRSNYVLVTDSRSLQEGTKENPRIVMFGKAANIFVAFNGGKGRGGDTIEAIEHHRETNTYEFRRYFFSTDGSKAVTQVKNPPMCAACHGTDSHPIWDPYPVWPSAIPRSFLVNPTERKYVDSFIASAFNNQRYRGLLRQKNLDDMINIRLETSMASQMDDQLNEERVRRLVAKLKATPQFEKYRFAIVAALSYCQNIEAYLPQAVVARMNAVSTRATLIAKTTKDIQTNAVAHDGLFSFTPANAEVTGSLRWLLETRSINMGDFGLSLRTPYLYTTTAETFYPRVIADLSGDNTHFFLLSGVLSTPFERKALWTAQNEKDHEATARAFGRKAFSSHFN